MSKSYLDENGNHLVLKLLLQGNGSILMLPSKDTEESRIASLCASRIRFRSLKQFNMRMETEIDSRHNLTIGSNS